MDWNKYKKVEGKKLDVDRTWPEKGKDLEVNETLEGGYVEKIEGVGDNNSNVYVLEVEGDKVGVWGSTVLDTKFKNIAVGKIVGIEYLGRVKSEKGGRSYKDFNVGVGIDNIGDEE